MPANPFQDETIVSFVDLGIETLVNVETNSNQQNPSVAVMSDGRIVVAWESNLQDGSGLGVFARVFDADGSALTGDLPINVTTAGSQANPTVVALSNGAANVFWTSGSDLFYRGIAADNTTPAGEIQLNDEPSAANYDVTPLPSQDFMVTFEAPDGVGNSSGIFGQRMLFTGGEFFNEFRINAEASGAQRRADTAELTSQTVFTVFQSQGQTTSPSDQGIYMRSYSNTSTLQGSTDILVADDTGVLEVNPAIAALDGGGFVVAWVNSTSGEIWAEGFIDTGFPAAMTRTNVSGTVGANTLVAPVLEGLPGDRYVVVWQNNATLGADLYYKVLEADGTTVTTGLLHTNTAGGQADPQVHVLPQGGFITTFTSGSGSALDLFIVRHAEDGTPAGPALQVEYPVNTTTAGSQQSADVSISDDGEIVVVWQSNFQDGSGFGVYLQRFASPEVGTTSADLIDGDTEDDFIAGWTGDDTLNGLDGNDRLDGGDGNDDLSGGDGNDTLNGNDGNDDASGGAGNDVVRGDLGSDTLSGDEGNDVLSGDAGNDVLNGGNGEDLLFGGSDNDLLFGGDNFDRLFGGSGVDKLFGGAANDIANGGADNDIINTGSGNDLVFAQGGNDLVFAQAGNDDVFGGAGNDKVFGGNGNDDLNGGAGNDEIFGGAGVDLITGATGDDTLSGGGDGDTFVLFANQGADRITDFSGSDRLDISSFGLSDGSASDQDWRGATTSVVTSGGGANVTIAWTGGGTLVIENIGIASLTDSDFLF